MSDKKEERPTRVALCIPSGDLIFADFAMSLLNLVSYSRGVGLDIAIINQKTSHIDMGRHALVKQSLDHGADYTMFLDTDMVFPFNALERLLAWQKNIVGASYLKRRPPHMFTHTDLDGGCKEFRYGVAALQNEGNGLRKVKRLPTGMMLVHTDVYRKVAEPWFDSRWNPESGQRISEDNAFCDDARAQGFDIWLDEIMTGEIGHIGQTTFKPVPCTDGLQSADIEVQEGGDNG